MTVVLADTSPLNYLVLIGEVELLSRLYSQILIPDVVAAELRDPAAPLVVRKWATQPPSWVEIRLHPIRPNGLNGWMPANAPPFSLPKSSPRQSSC